jgi:trimeric autotransporter adhesin
MKNNLSRHARTFAGVSSLLAGLVTVACGGSSTSPTAPAGTAVSRSDPTVFMITIDRDRETRVNNRTLLFTAIARLSDGSQKDVTALADWRSSNPAVATVEAGRVSLLDSGELTLSAAYRGAVAQIHVGVTIFGDAPALAPMGQSDSRDSRLVRPS